MKTIVKIEIAILILVVLVAAGMILVSEGALNLFYDSQIPDEDFTEAAEYFRWFILCGEPESKNPGPQLLDWEVDAQVIVADTNIPAETLVYLAENCTAPIFCDPVSTIKAEKLRPVLNKIHTLKPNRLEAELLSGVAIRSKADAEAAAKVLLEKGVQRVFLSMGSDGMYAATADTQLWMDNIPGSMVNTTGCGDSFMGALVWAYLEGMNLEDTAAAGLAA